MAKLLVISLVDPRSHPGGAGTYTRGLLEGLKRSGRHDIQFLGPLHAPPGPWKRSRQLLSLLKSGFSSLPAKVLFARRREFQTRIRQTVCAQDFDAVLINGSDMLWALNELPPTVPAILVAHNQEHQVLTQLLGHYPVLTHIFRREILKQSNYELEGYRRVHGVIFLSHTDLTWGCSRVPSLRALHVPPLFADSSIVCRQRQSSGTLRLGLLADFAWWPNRQNWQWLVNDILPHVSRPIVVHVFGRQSEGLAAPHHVVVHGMVSDLHEVWREMDIMICPIQIGAGVSIKLAESLYHRMPVLATTLAIRGLACSAGEGLEVINSAAGWIEFLNSSKADRLAAQTPSEEMSRQFSVDRHCPTLEHFLQDVVSNGEHARSGSGDGV